MSDVVPAAELRAGHERFLALVGDVRAELHRYCARMTGSVADGEDLVQDTLARAFSALSELETLPPLRPWLFRIAHNAAVDHLRSAAHRTTRPLDDVVDPPLDPAPSPEEALASAQAVEAALHRFLALPATQRSAVILKDVLGASLEEIAELLDVTVPAVKAALHRGRTSLRDASGEERLVPTQASPALARYAALFNARDWDGVRAMLRDDVRLDLVSRLKRAGREVGSYVSNYAMRDDWHFVPAFLDGKEVLAAFRSPADAAPSYFVELTFQGDAVSSIRDFRYVPYIARDAAFVLLGERKRP
jgi:RNA polymerase sigma-70 factor (ECF subfamily)